MGMFQEYMRGVAMRKNPQLLQQRLQNMEASKMAQMAEQVYGSRAADAQAAEYAGVQGPTKYGAMDLNMSAPMAAQPAPIKEAVEAKAATGMFDQTIPERERRMLMNKRMLETGLHGFNQQWAKNQSAMQNSDMSNLGNMARQIQQQRYDTANPTATSAMKNLSARGLKPGTAPYQHAMKKYMEKQSIIGGGGESKLNFATPEQVAQLGYSPGTQVLIDKNNKPYLPAGMNENSAKNKSYYNMMVESENLEADIQAQYPDFDPSETIDATLRSIQSGGGTLQQIIGKAQSPASKAYLTAEMNWIAANRGALSGAAVPEIEVERDLQTYYPQAGDPPEVIAYKKRLRAARKDSIRSTLNMPDQERKKFLKEGADKDYEDVRSKVNPKQPRGKAPPGLSREAWQAGRDRGEW